MIKVLNILFDLGYRSFSDDVQVLFQLRVVGVRFADFDIFTVGCSFAGALSTTGHLFGAIRAIAFSASHALLGMEDLDAL